MAKKAANAYSDTNVSVEKSQPPERARGGSMEEQDTYEAALKAWGARAQMDMFIEEAAEATHAIVRFYRGRVTVDDVMQELVDVDIMLSQMRVLLNDESKWQRWRAYKMDRLKGLLQLANAPAPEQP